VPSIPQQLTVLGIREIFSLDTEYRPPDPEGYKKLKLPPELAPEAFEPVCLTAYRWTTEEKIVLWPEQGQPCPFPVGEDTLFITYQAPAEWSYFLAMGWELPTNIIDLYAEYRRAINGRLDKSGTKVGKDEHKDADGRTKYGLLSACHYYGLPTRAGTEKSSVVTRILQGGPYNKEERAMIADYCYEDTQDATAIAQTMFERNEIESFGQALMRGDATRGFACREMNGIPIDVPLALRFKENWESIRTGLATAVEAKNGYGVYRLKNGVAHFDNDKMAELIARLGMEDIWPKTDTGKYSLADPDRGNDDDKPFKRMAELNPYLLDLRNTRKLLEQFKRFSLPIRADGRCHGKYAPWVQTTGRSSPGKGSIFALPAWARFLIKPAEGQAVAYIDLRSAEFGIGAALSHDPQMMQDYLDVINGVIEDAYFELAKRAGAVPPDAKMKDHKTVRKLWKTACLAMMYGQTPEGLCRAAGVTLSLARVIHAAFKARYPIYWAWVKREVVHAHVAKKIETICGWRMYVGKHTKDNTLLDYHMQATCSDIMRRAIALAVDSGVALCDIVHDAMLVEDSIDRIDATVELVKECWRQASREILCGFQLDADAKIFKYPERYVDDDGKSMFDHLMNLLEEAERNSDMEEKWSTTIFAQSQST